MSYYLKTVEDLTQPPKPEDRDRAARVIVEHAWWGCETGCCGTNFEIQDEAGKALANVFEFGHDDAEARELQLAVAETLGIDAPEFPSLDVC